jgi:spermidine synthase
MIPWVQIDTARVPGAEVELRLMRRGAEFSMMLGPNELMNSRLSGSEEAELVPAVIDWAKGPMAEIFGNSLDDPRADIRRADVIEVIQSHASAFDTILLDVDNGPEGLIRKANDALYDLKGLKAIRRALRPGGVLAVWSSGPDPHFTKRLRDAGFDVNEVAVRAPTKTIGVFKSCGNP